MRGRMTKLFAAVGAIAALAVGGAALAGAAGNQAAPAKAPVAAVKTLKAGGQTGVNQSTADEPGQESATETPEGASESASEPAESASEIPGDDGPGGHADEPGNPNADHQFEGQE
jgi:hypothetical protein